jgi:hypothetical protein
MPVKDAVEVAVAALPVMLPTMLAVIVLAAKLPVASRLTSVEAEFALVPPLAKLAPAATLAA